MARLRGPGGCPWDREQTLRHHQAAHAGGDVRGLRRDRAAGWPELKDELGDLLLQVLFYAQMAAEAGYFDIADVAAELNAKLVRRHPHIFPADGRGGRRGTRCCATGSRSSARRRRRECGQGWGRVAAGRCAAHHAGDDGGGEAGVEGGQGGLRLAGRGGAFRQAATKR